MMMEEGVHDVDADSNQIVMRKTIERFSSYSAAAVTARFSTPPFHRVIVERTRKIEKLILPLPMTR